MSFGVAGMGVALGDPVPVAAAADEYLTDQRQLSRWGYGTFHRAGPSVGITDLAVEAGRRALDAAGVTAAEVDVVVLAISDVAEHLYWDPAAACQHRIGASRAEAILVNQACGGAVTAFDTVAGRFATHPDHEVALIIGANRVCETYVNRMAVNTCVNGDGAAAVVVRRSSPGLRWLVTETVTDGTYADYFRLEGGTAQPFGGGEPPRIRDPFTRLAEFFDNDVRAMVEFGRMTVDRLREVVERACKRAEVSAVARVVHLNDNVIALGDLAKALDLPLSAVNADVAAAHGHLGCADQILGLSWLVERDLVAPGEVVALTSTGSGMHWTCTLIEV
ncbi:3-oxoacyl-[acyl-carrier-protein] synthase-3 [Lentzea waywayandensis]|uniref:3-oxoacyl-[acyl-carrier-protein] synthase-3 n=1 Tax=Lentzea waywayandensis TaxID=84724 RepID=A0A1I6FGP1_9PSEU|nr:3-oxoacyl-[acyl-carrier-protein] synthase III C-terminal domain-containing protein [Lentzea waywayandensis]SFR29113.1 3-oxoacyl-[acyl-carrier-protein] synthase-3 [Lentzea waywayandensis]